MSKVQVSAEIEALATTVVNAAFSVHKALGPGLLESAYHECLAIEFSLVGLRFQRELSLPLTYRDQIVLNAYRVDMIVNDQLLIELKAIESIQPIHRVQATTYLRLLKLPLGLLINFNVPLIKDGITRVLNLDFRAPASSSFASSRLRA
jgi:GxxExxY protein